MNNNELQTINLLKEKEFHSIDDMSALLLGLPPSHITYLTPWDECTLSQMPESETPPISSYILIEELRHCIHEDQVFKFNKNKQVFHEKHDLFFTLTQMLIDATNNGEIQKHIPRELPEKVRKSIKAQKVTNGTLILVQDVALWAKRVGFQTDFFEFRPDYDSINSHDAEKAESTLPKNKTVLKSNRSKACHTRAIESAFLALGKDADNVQIYEWIKNNSEAPSKEHENFLMYLEFEGDDIDNFSVTNQKSTILKSKNKPISKQGFQDICSKIRNNS